MPTRPTGLRRTAAAPRAQGRRPPEPRLETTRVQQQQNRNRHDVAVKQQTHAQWSLLPSSWQKAPDPLECPDESTGSTQASERLQCHDVITPEQKCKRCQDHHSFLKLDRPWNTYLNARNSVKQLQKMYGRGCILKYHVSAKKGTEIAQHHTTGKRPTIRN